MVVGKPEGLVSRVNFARLICPLTGHESSFFLGKLKIAALLAVGHPDVLDLCGVAQECLGRQASVQSMACAVVDPCALEVARRSFLDRLSCAGSLKAPDGIDVHVARHGLGDVDVAARQDVHHTCGHIRCFQNLHEIGSGQRERLRRAQHDAVAHGDGGRHRGDQAPRGAHRQGTGPRSRQRAPSSPRPRHGSVHRALARRICRPKRHR